MNTVRKILFSIVRLSYECWDSAKWRINKFQVYQRDVILCNSQFSSIPLQLQFHPILLSNKFVKWNFPARLTSHLIARVLYMAHTHLHIRISTDVLSVSLAASSYTYEQFLFSVLLGNLLLFLSIFSSFYVTVPREWIGDRCAYSNVIVVGTPSVSVCTLFILFS